MTDDGMYFDEDPARDKELIDVGNDIVRQLREKITSDDEVVRDAMRIMVACYVVAAVNEGDALEENAERRDNFIELVDTTVDAYLDKLYEKRRETN